MKLFSLLLSLALVSSCVSGKEATYIGSTPADGAVRSFLGISLIDSIDFIRWKLVIHPDHYNLDCEYGVGKPSTNGFIDRKTVMFSGKLAKQGNYYSLQQEKRTFFLLEINSNLLYLLDQNKNLLVGNGGFSYTLNNDKPVKTDRFNFESKQAAAKKSIMYEGRTPCQELSGLLKLNKGANCNKLKWLFIFYTDSITEKPSHYLTAGTAYREETMAKGKWEIIKGKDGRIIYKLNPEKQAYTIYLLKADDNILFFTDDKGNLLTGNEDFSYVLNIRYKEYPAAR